MLFDELGMKSPFGLALPADAFSLVLSEGEGELVGLVEDLACPRQALDLLYLCDAALAERLVDHLCQVLDLLAVVVSHEVAELVWVRVWIRMKRE